MHQQSLPTPSPRALRQRADTTKPKQGPSCDSVGYRSSAYAFIGAFQHAHWPGLAEGPTPSREVSALLPARPSLATVIEVREMAQSHLAHVGDQWECARHGLSCSPVIAVARARRPALGLSYHRTRPDGRKNAAVGIISAAAPNPLYILTCLTRAPKNVSRAHFTVRK